MKEWSITTFSEKLASDEPTPGGGAGAGVAGALGVSAIMMAIRFSTTAKKLTDSEKELLVSQIDVLEAKRVKMLDLIDEDATGFEPLAAAFAMPKATDAEKADRDQALQAGYMIALSTPASLLDTAIETVEIVNAVLPFIKKSIISDIGVGVQLLRSAAYASLLNVTINTESLSDAAQGQEIYQNTVTKLENVSKEIDMVFEKVQNKILGK